MRRLSIRRRVSQLALLPVLVVGTGLGGCVGQQSEETVSVWASWTDSEEASFRQVLDAFTEKHGIRVEYQGTRAVRQILSSEVQKGTPPDIAVLPTLSEMAGYLRRGALKPLDGGSQMSRQWRDLTQLDDTDNLYVVPIKADLKSLVWYVPTPAPPDGEWPPRTWPKLLDASRKLAAEGRTPWCLGMGATPGSGWPGTDWIEDILLHRSGSEPYQRWSAGELEWTSSEVRAAWRAWGDLVHAPGMVRGGTLSALLTEFGDAGRPMFVEPPGCLLHHQASFQTGIHEGYVAAAVKADATKTRELVSTADYFPFPTFVEADAGSPDDWVVSADVAGLFTDKPQARKLIEFLATDEAQQIWPDKSGGRVFSVNRNVDWSNQDEVSRRIATTLTDGRSRLCLDASDAMPATMATAFQHALLEFLQYPDRLDQLLGDLDELRQSIHSNDSKAWLRLSCSGPGS